MTVQLVGASGSGKSVQLGLLAQHVHRTQGRKSIIYHADPGGYAHLAPHINRGYLTVVDLNAYSPWKAYESAVQGKLPPAEPYRVENGKRLPNLWPPNLDFDKIGFFGFEGMSSWCWKMAADILTLAQQGVNIGGAGKADMIDHIPGEDTKLGNISRNNYGQIQKRIKRIVWDSFKLHAGRPDVYVVWTALDHTGDDETGGQKLLGSKLMGNAMASETPQWFNQTYHTCALPAHGGGVEYRLYTRVHVDPSNPNVWGLANTRAPLELDENGDLVVTEVPDYITPANIVKALALVEGRKEEVAHV